MRVRWDRTKGSPEPLRALDGVRLQERAEPLVDLRIACPSVTILRPSVIPYLRESVANMLERAASKLPPHYRLAVTDAWRPLERQRRIYDWMLKCAREAFPDRSLASLKRTVNRVVHAYDRKAPPGHCTGAAVDVNILDAAGNSLDVSAPFNRFQASRTYTLGLEPQARERRMALVEAMLAVGFSNCRDEWWHYSFGDAAWAVRVGSPVCYYSWAHLPPELYTQAEQEWLKQFEDRPNPFLES